MRFVIADIDPDSGRRQGLFQAGELLLSSGRLAREDAEQLRAMQRWFRGNLPVPTRFSVSTRPHGKAQAISWFRDTAIEHIARMRGYERILGAYGITVETLRTGRPGYVVYEDEHQVVAYPFADTPC